MRHIARKIAVALALFGIASTCIAADQVQWAPNIDQARLMAAQQNKLLLIHFWSPMCGPCKTVDAKVFPNSAVGAAINQNFVALKVNAASNEGRQLTAHFNVEQVPTDVVSTVAGKALHRMVSDTNPSLYAQKISTLGQQFAMKAKYSPQARSQQPQQTQAVKKYENRPMQTAMVGTEPPLGTPAVSDSQLGVTTSPLSPNTAVARRPGVNPNMLPGRGLGNQQPGYTAPQIGAGNRFSSTTQTPAAQTQPQRSAATNYANNTQSYSPSISNPYAKAGVSQSNVPQQTQPAPTNKFVNPNVSQQVATTPAYSAPSYSTQQNTNVPPTTNGPAMGAAASNFVNPTAQGAPLATSQPLNPQLVTQQTPAQTVTRQTVAPQTLNPMAAGPRVAANPGLANPSDGSPIPSSADSSVGLEGRCPVWLITNGSWKKGDKRWGAVHRGKTYLFSSQEAQQKFLAAPDDFSPVLAGMDIVRLASDGAVAQGTRRYGVLFDDDGSGPRRSRMFLFDSVDTRNRFEADPDMFLQPVMQAVNSGQLDRLIR